MAAAGAAAIVNGSRGNRLPMSLDRAFYSIESGARPILVREAARLYEQGRAAFLDARPTGRFALGQIDGALPVPADQWPEISEDVLPWIEGRRIVVYGDAGEINAVDDLAGSVLSGGIPRDSVFIFMGGIEGWRAAGLPVREGESSILSGDIGVESSGESDVEPPGGSEEEPPR